jgi:hypothetical protein
MESFKSSSSLCERLNAPSRSLRGVRDVFDKVVEILLITVIVQSIQLVKCTETHLETANLVIVLVWGGREGRLHQLHPARSRASSCR